MKHLLFFTFLITLFQNSFAQVLDNSFSNDGKLLIPISSENDLANAMIIDASGNIYLGGSTYDGYTNDFAITKIKPDGTLDNSFNTDGILTINLTNMNDVINVMIADPSGNIYLAGRSGLAYDNSTLAIAKIKPDGTFDNTFDGDGKLDISIEYGFNASGIVIDNNNNIIISGTSNSPNTTGQDFGVVKIKPDGSLDNSFSNDGILTIPIGFMSDFANELALDQYGNIFVSGDYYKPGLIVESAIVKIKPDGTLDNTFNNNGILTFNLSSNNEVISCMKLDASGNIYLGGTTNGNFLAIKLKPDGSFDTQFDNDGWITIPVGNQDAVALDIELDNFNSVYLCGITTLNSSIDMAIVKLQSNGSIDNNFDNDGKMTFQLGTAEDEANCMVLDNSGNIFLAGNSGNSSIDQDFAILKLTNTTSTDIINPNNNSLIKIYPIPSNGNLVITSDEEIEEIMLINYLGQTEIHTKKEIHTNFKGQVTARIKSSSGITIKKLIIE